MSRCFCVSNTGYLYTYASVGLSILVFFYNIPIFVLMYLCVYICMCIHGYNAYELLSIYRYRDINLCISVSLIFILFCLCVFMWFGIQVICTGVSMYLFYVLTCVPFLFLHNYVFVFFHIFLSL